MAPSGLPKKFAKLDGYPDHQSIGTGLLIARLAGGTEPQRKTSPPSMAMLLGDGVLASAVSWRRRLRLVCTNERGCGDNRPAIFGAVKFQSAKTGAFGTGCP